MNLTATYPGRPLRQVRTVALPVRKGTAADQNVRSWGIDDAREQRHDQIDDALFDAICEVIGEEDLPEFGPGGRWAILSHFDSRWAGTVTLQNLADAMGVSRERMRQIETVGLRKAEARLGGRRMSTHSECYAGRRRVRTGGVERMIPVDGHGIKRRRTPATPRDVINARCLEALREMTADGRYVTATAVAEAIGIGGSSTAVSLHALALAGKVQRETNRFGRCGWRIPAGTVRDGE